MMETDQLIAVDENDRIVVAETGDTAGSDGAAAVTKKDGHRFNDESPRGVLHRAFSVFVFDQHGRLMLTRRAAAKITFPNVWTNACCSHPLHGMTPNEVDDINTDAKEDDDHVRTEGIKNAVVRKLQHELGIAPDSIDKDRLVFVKRFHYWASDTITYGNDSPWGEHEIDYIFFYQAPVVVASTSEDKDDPLETTTTTTTTTHTLPPTLVIRPNPEEVAAYEFVTKAELGRRMRQHEQSVRTAEEEEEEVLWSPWFVGIMERGGFDWWDDLDRTLQGRYTSKEITYFDPPARHVAAYNLPHHGRTTGVAATVTTAAATKASTDSR
jgi:isopentenyl-diphosphate delta-isomerase type 1